MPPGVEFYQRTVTDHVIRETAAKLRRAKRQVQYNDLAGEDKYEPYESLKRDLLQAMHAIQESLAEIEMLEKHAHRWNADDYCDICGADGRV